MIKQITICIVLVVVLCEASPNGGYGHDDGHHGGKVIHHGGGGYGGGKHDAHKGHGYGKNDYHNAHPKYDFAYGVKDDHYGPNFGHSESRDGYNTKGEYYVHLPDGRVQKVSYYVDEWGYHPTVTYEGKAHFPTHHKGYSSKGHDGYKGDSHHGHNDGYKH